MADTSLKARLKRTFAYILRGVPVQNIKAEIVIRDTKDLLKGKNIIITGGGRGLGFYIAKKCMESGANVIITGRNENTLKESSRLLCNCHYVTFDVQNIDGISEFFDECEQKFNGHVDCVVNNAGVSHHEVSFYAITQDDWDVQFTTNLKAPFFITQEFCKRFEKNNQTKGSVLFVSSERSFFCDERPYGLIKAAINSMTGGIARRYVDKGIRVNAVAPGVTASDMTGFKKDGDLFYDNSCGHRVYLPEEVAETVVFLLSDAAGCISGHVIPTNRGNHLRCDW